MSNYKGSARWKFVVLFSIFAMVVVACAGDTADDVEVVEEETEATETTSTTAAEVVEESSAPEGVFKMGIYSDPQGFNIWDAVDVQQDYWTFATLSPQATSLFGTNYPSYTLVTNMAAELVETSVDNGDGTFSYTVPITEGFKWSDGEACLLYTSPSPRDS